MLDKFSNSVLNTLPKPTHDNCFYVFVVVATSPYHFLSLSFSFSIICVVLFSLNNKNITSLCATHVKFFSIKENRGRTGLAHNILTFNCSSLSFGSGLKKRQWHNYTGCFTHHLFVFTFNEMHNTPSFGAE